MSKLMYKISIQIILYFVFLLFSCKQESRSVIYINDCDGYDGWLQEKSFTTEKSYSGNKSSLMGKNRYGLTFNKRFKDISDVIDFNEVNVQVAIFSEFVKEKCGIIVNVLQENHENKLTHVDFQRYEFKDELKDKEWVTIKKSFHLPVKKIKKEHLLRIFVYSSENEKIFVDDFRIELK